MHRNQSVSTHAFAMVPRADIPRSTFLRQMAHKTTFDAGFLIPFFVDEVLPGDTFQLSCTTFCRMATPVFPVLDNLYIETFYFFVPCRLVWDNWQRFQGQQDDPGSSISFVIPQLLSAANGFVVGSIYDYLGLPTVGQVTAAATVSVNALPLRCYNLIFNEWFRDENLINSQQVPLTDGPDAVGAYGLLRRGKRHDYFTSCLPWTQKGGVPVTLPLGTLAPVKTATIGTDIVTGAQAGLRMKDATGATTANNTSFGVGTAPLVQSGATVTYSGIALYPSNLYADLTGATAATINQLRQSVQIQRLLERDARSGSRYTEIVRAHFGVISPDARLQRPEYLGGGSSPIQMSEVPQTSGTGLSGGTTPIGTIAGSSRTVSSSGFTQSFTEHGYIIGLVNVRADLTYQQGLRRLWSRSTRYDFYMPVFSTLGEQAVLNKEIYAVGSATGGVGAGDQDMQVFGYQERWAEYRYLPSLITGKFRSTSAGTIDPWHLSQKFTALPTLNATFINDTPPISRVVAAGSAADGQQFLLDAFFSVRSTRQMPLYSVPGQMDHF